MQKFIVEFLWICVKLLSYLPLNVLYIFSDVMYVVVYYFVRYRREVVRKNLLTSFPNKSERDILSIEKDFYRYLCDLFVEFFKFIDIDNEKFLRDHVIYYNVKEVDEAFSRGQDITCLLGHYGNWEWLDGTQLCFEVNRDASVGLVFQKMRNKIANEIKERVMCSKNGITIDKDKFLRTAIKYRNENRRILYGLVADQTPTYHNTHLWLDFLNHQTGVFTGAEKIAQKLDHTVFYMAMRRESRGRYTLHYEKICDHAKDMDIEKMTRIFFDKLESQVKEDPTIYLWTHNRWKRTKEVFDRKFFVKGDRVFDRKDIEQK